MMKIIPLYQRRHWWVCETILTVPPDDKKNQRKPLFSSAGKRQIKVGVEWTKGVSVGGGRGGTNTDRHNATQLNWIEWGLLGGLLSFYKVLFGGTFLSQLVKTLTMVKFFLTRLVGWKQHIGLFSLQKWKVHHGHSLHLWKPHIP